MLRRKDPGELGDGAAAEGDGAFYPRLDRALRRRVGSGTSCEDSLSIRQFLYYELHEPTRR